jgi:hypothetical protein
MTNDINDYKALCQKMKIKLESKVKNFFIERRDQEDSLKNMASAYNVGDFVTCYVDIKGKMFEKRDGSGQGIITTLKCWNVEKEGKTFKEIKV